MKKTILFAFIFCFTAAAYASYPVACQLNMLSAATSVFQEDPSIYSYFDLSKVTFGTSSNNKPIVLFEGSSANTSKQLCRTEVKMEIPQETLGCPSYKVSSVSTICE